MAPILHGGNRTLQDSPLPGTSPDALVFVDSRFRGNDGSPVRGNEDYGATTSFPRKASTVGPPVVGEGTSAMDYRFRGDDGVGGARRRDDDKMRPVWSPSFPPKQAPVLLVPRALEPPDCPPGRRPPDASGRSKPRAGTATESPHRGSRSAERKAAPPKSGTARANPSGCAPWAPARPPRPHR